MKIKRTSKGYLQIERGGEYIQQCCPHSVLPAVGFESCGDWCPLFGEPEHESTVTDYGCDEKGFVTTSIGSREIIQITICQGRVLVGEIIDERGK